MDVPSGLEELGVAIGLTWHAVGFALGLAVVFPNIHTVGLLSWHTVRVAMAHTMTALWLMATRGSCRDNPRLALGAHRKPSSLAVAHGLPWPLPWYGTTVVKTNNVYRWKLTLGQPVGVLSCVCDTVAKHGSKFKRHNHQRCWLIPQEMKRSAFTAVISIHVRE